jgi:hypothetical protein
MRLVPALALALSLASQARADDPRPEISDRFQEADRERFLAATRFVETRSVKEVLPAVSREWATLLGVPVVRIAEPDGAYQATDIVTDAEQPKRRLLFAAASGDLYLLAYERGGFASHGVALVFRVEGDGARLVWGGSFLVQLAHAKGVQEAIRAGKASTRSLDWNW